MLALRETKSRLTAVIVYAGAQELNQRSRTRLSLHLFSADRTKARMTMTVPHAAGCSSSPTAKKKIAKASPARPTR